VSKEDSPHPVRDPGRAWSSGLAWPLAVAALAYAAFTPALRGGFVSYDDVDLFVHNGGFRGLGARNLEWMFTTTRMGHYAPLTWLSHAVEFAGFGLDPAAFHRTNLLLHALNAACVFLLAVRLLAAARPREASEHPLALKLAAAAAACLFAVHPLRAESVAWITERRGLLGSLFLLLALLAYLRACPRGSAAVSSRGAYAASVLLLVLSLLSKGLGMAFVGMVVVLDFYPLRRIPAASAGWRSPAARPVWIQKIPFLLLGLVSAAISAWAARSAAGTVLTLEQWGPLARAGQAAFGLAFYVRKTLHPLHLAAVVELPYRFDPTEPRFLASALAVLLAIVLLAATRRRWPALAAASAAYALALAPVLGLLQAGPQLVADRYSYLACIPWALLAGGGLLAASARCRPIATSALFAAAGVAVIALFRLSLAQAATWVDTQTLWEHAIAAGEPSSVAYVNLGSLHAEAGDSDAAIESYRAALRLRPDQGLAWFDLGIQYAARGRLEEAVQADREACRTLKPAYKALVNLGVHLDRLGRLDEALEPFRAAVADADAAGPELYSPVPHLVLGAALRRQGLDAEGRRHLQIAAASPETRAEALRELSR